MKKYLIMLFFATVPLILFSQIPLYMTYHKITVNVFVLKSDSSTKIQTSDTISFQSVAEINISSTNIAIDRYSTYKIIGGENWNTPDQKMFVRRYYLSNGYEFICTNIGTASLYMPSPTNPLKFTIVDFQID